MDAKANIMEVFGALRDILSSNLVTVHAPGDQARQISACLDKADQILQLINMDVIWVEYDEYEEEEEGEEYDDVDERDSASSDNP